MKKVCHIVGGGPSLIGFDWRSLDTEFCIAVNDAYRELPQAAIVLYSLQQWGLTNWPGLSRHRALKMLATRDPNANPPPPTLQLRLTKSQGLDLRPGHVAGSCTGHMAINLAVSLGFREVWLYGFDCRREKSATHWHQSALFQSHAAEYRYFARSIDALASELRALDVIVRNLSPDSALQNFPKIKVRPLSKPDPAAFTDS